MEIICFGLGLIAGLLITAGHRETRNQETPKEENIPPELMKQYEELFGYDGKHEK